MNKKLIALLLTFGLVAMFSGNALALEKYSVEFIDENGKPITSGIEFRVKTAGSNTDVTVYQNDSTATPIPAANDITVSWHDTVNPTGVTYWWIADTSVDLVANSKGEQQSVDGFTSDDDRRIRFDSRRLTPFDSGNDITAAASITIPQGGSFFNVEGTTKIETIVTANQTAGRRVTLLFHGPPQIDVRAGNIRGMTVGQAQTVVMTTGQTVDFVYDGTLYWDGMGGGYRSCKTGEPCP